MSPRVVCWYDRNLPLTDHGHNLIPGNCPWGCLEPLEAEPGSDQMLDTPVVLLDDIIQKFYLPEFGKPPEFSILFHDVHRNGIGGVLIDGDGSRIGRV